MPADGRSGPARDRPQGGCRLRLGGRPSAAGVTAPIANIFPAFEGEQFAAFTEDIRTIRNNRSEASERAAPVHPVVAESIAKLRVKTDAQNSFHYSPVLFPTRSMSWKGRRPPRCSVANRIGTAVSAR